MSKETQNELLAVVAMMKLIQRARNDVIEAKNLQLREEGRADVELIGQLDMLDYIENEFPDAIASSIAFLPAK